VSIGYSSDDGQPCPGSLHLTPHGPLKQLKDPLGMFRGDPGSPIAHDESLAIGISLSWLVGGNLYLGRLPWLC